MLAPHTVCDDAAPDCLDASATLAFAAGAQAAEQAARVAVLEAAGRWAGLPGAERLVRFGGAGTPEVAEFCPAELGAVLGMSTFAASRLIGDALDLRHRLPQLWARVRAGQVKAWIGQRAAQATRDQSAEVAAAVDARIAPVSDRIGWTRLEAIIDAVVIDADPAAATARAEAEQLAQGVWVGSSTEHGIKDIHIRTEAPHAIWFAATIDRIADRLAALGDTASKDVRRARAVGVIAQPQTALDLFARAAAQTDVDDISAPVGERRRRSVDSGPPVTLYLHLSDQALIGRAPVGRVETIGPVLTDQLRGWLTGCTVTVTPVIDLNDQTPVDGYEIPDRLRESVLLRSPIDCFPYGSNTSRSMDLDHTDEYVPIDHGGPPGQTRPDNLAPMTRRHHRIKTHGRWQVAQPFNGVLVWKSPHGHHHLVDHTGTQQAVVR